MADRPILFPAPMIRALLEGRKTQTRRVINPNGGNGTPDNPLQFRPRYLIGDRLWVRETWAPLSALTHNDHGAQALADRGFYRADEGTVEGEITAWKPSIFMPRWASRLTLEVTDVRVERLQDITEEDAIAEGVGPLCHPEGRPDLTWVGRPIHCKAPSRAYKDLWDTINTKRGHSWKQNPWVAAYTFRVIKQNIDEVGL